ncbi:HAD-IIA family hydrolase [Paenarthrobacter sp. NPDC056912]|uniref:HAD-IIA family hydrolase n=1 Tax=Paenarthrobacter sp. NPDC056912 TaxID=3345965 RepID=UPI00366D7DF0
MSDETLVLCDLDGTLYERGSLIPGAQEAVAAMRSVATVRFMTNTDSSPTVDITRRLEAYGLGSVDIAEVFTPVAAAAKRLSGLDRAVLLVNQGVSAELGAVVRPALVRGESAGAVVVGDVRGVLDYELLDLAFDAIRNGADLLALQRGRYFRAADGDHIDTGAVVAALEFATGVQAQILGKPSVDFVELAIASAGSRNEFGRVIVVGDDRSSDIRMAADSGLESIQVRTGKAADQAGDQCLPEADHVVDTIREAVRLIGLRL